MEGGEEARDVLLNLQLAPTPPRLSAPLHIILAPLCVSHIDLWILDVEGAELDVLQGVDFERIEIDVISAEAADNSPVKNALVIKLLESKGFVHEGYLGRNDWFRRAGFVPHRGHGLVSLNVTSRGQAPLPARLAPDWAAYWLFDKVSQHKWRGVRLCVPKVAALLLSPGCVPSE